MDDTIRILIPIVGAHLAVLVIIIFVIKKLLLGDTVRAVERIGQAEAEIRKKEEAMRQEMERHEQELNGRRKELEREFEERRDVAARETAVAREQALEQARREAGDILEKARKNERKLRDQLGLELEEKAVDFGGNVFRLVFSERMTEEINKHFINELLDALEETDASGITVTSTEAQFMSSHPLSDDQKARLKDILSRKFGLNIDINETIQEELVAGLVMKLGSLEIDGSLRNRYQEAVTELKKDAA